MRKASVNVDRSAIAPTAARHAFILTDQRDHLHRVVVSVAAVHRFDVAAAVGVGVVDESDRTAVFEDRLSLCDPFVPAGYENHFWVLSDRPAELLVEVIAVEISVF